MIEEKGIALGLWLRQQAHDVGGRAMFFEQASHHLHVGRHMGEEVAVALTEVVEPRLAVGRQREAVARALAMARPQPRALAALARPKRRWRSPYIISTSDCSRMLPSRYSGNTKWSHE